MNGKRIIPRSVVCGGLLFATSALRAQQVDDPSAICTDRPTKSNAPCVVDRGVFQYEADLGNYTRLRLDGTTTETWLVTNPTIKYGIAKDIDVEAGIAPREVIRTRNADGSASTQQGLGDLYLRLKWNVLPPGDDDLSVSALPYIKVPTARRGIGNRAVEGGVLLPASYQITDSLILTAVPEFDAFKDAVGGGRHVNTSQIVNIGYSVTNDVMIYGELWGAWNLDPAGTVRQYSADIAATWAILKNLQVDFGLNFGLNRFTPGLQAYFGISQKF